MISIQLADAFQSIFGIGVEEPSVELIKRYNQAARSIVNSFTIKLTEDDEIYLYSRYKKIKNDAGYFELLTRPYLIYLFYVQLRGYSTAELMQQYISRVEQLGVNVDEKRGEGFVRGPSKMTGDDSTLSDEDFSNKRVQLFDFIRNGDIRNIKNLIAVDPQLVHQSYLDIYPIHNAADVGQLTALEVLISSGANVNQKDSDGQTALHYGASNGYYEVCKVLLEAGTDPKIGATTTSLLWMRPLTPKLSIC
ncbi:Myotrophin [Aphelenchoides bicaudatus]|nr:Myotrophin [Aphelenchoides bicaudatus]